MNTQKISINTFEELSGFCSFLKNKITLPSILLLEGDLGSGKTTFTQYLCKEFGYEGAVNSPTFGKIHEYKCQNKLANDLTIFHLDLYRELPSVDEFEELLLEENALILVEWANLLDEQNNGLEEIKRLKDRQILQLKFKITKESRQVELAE